MTIHTSEPRYCEFCGISGRCSVCGWDHGDEGDTEGTQEPATPPGPSDDELELLYLALMPADLWWTEHEADVRAAVGRCVASQEARHGR